MTTRGHDPSLPADRRLAGPDAAGIPPAAGSRRPWANATTLTTAFSLVEILVTVTLLSVIVLGLLAMFNQTQRAFRSSMTQTDVLESGRAVMELLARELEQIAPANLANTTNFYAFYIPRLPDPANPLTLELPGSGSFVLRTNVLQEFFFLTRSNQYWSGIGYLVSTPDLGVGTLYRYETNAHNMRPDLVANFSRSFKAASLGNLHRVVDGIVHLRLLAFATNGTLIDPNWGITNTTIKWDILPGEIQYSFYSNAVPAYVEVELGILESQVLGRYQSMTGSSLVASNFLRMQAGQVHVFRQRVPIRNVNSAAYQ